MHSLVPPMTHTGSFRFSSFLCTADILTKPVHTYSFGPGVLFYLGSRSEEQMNQKIPLPGMRLNRREGTNIGTEAVVS